MYLKWYTFIKTVNAKSVASLDVTTGATLREKLVNNAKFIPNGGQVGDRGSSFALFTNFSRKVAPVTLHGSFAGYVQ